MYPRTSSSTEYDQVLRQTLQLEGFHVSHRFRGREAGDIGDHRARSQIEKHTITRDHPLASVGKAHLHRLRSHEPGFALDQFGSGRLEAIEVKLNLTLHHLSLAANTPLMSVDTGPVWMPYSAACRANQFAFALRITFLLGKQAMFGQEPPMYFRSTAVRWPACAIVQVIHLPASPLPMTRIS